MCYLFEPLFVDFAEKGKDKKAVDIVPQLPNVRPQNWTDPAGPSYRGVT